MEYIVMDSTEVEISTPIQDEIKKIHNKYGNLAEYLTTISKFDDTDFDIKIYSLKEYLKENNLIDKIIIDFLDKSLELRKQSNEFNQNNNVINEVTEAITEISNDIPKDFINEGDEITIDGILRGLKSIQTEDKKNREFLNGSIQNLEKKAKEGVIKALNKEDKEYRKIDFIEEICKILEIKQKSGFKIKKEKGKNEDISLEKEISNLSITKDIEKIGNLINKYFVLEDTQKELIKNLLQIKETNNATVKPVYKKAISDCVDIIAKNILEKAFKDKQGDISKEIVEYLKENFGIEQKEIDEWNRKGVTNNQISLAIIQILDTQISGRNQTIENANGFRQTLALLLDPKNENALTPVIQNSLKEGFKFLEYSRELRDQLEKNTYRTDIDMSVMALALKNNIVNSQEKLGKFTKLTNDEKDNSGFFKTGQGKFVLTSSSHEDNIQNILKEQIDDFKDSGLFGKNGEETLIFLTPQTNGAHWTLAVNKVTFNGDKVLLNGVSLEEKDNKVKIVSSLHDAMKSTVVIDSLEDKRQSKKYNGQTDILDGERLWSCGIHTMEAAYSLITGTKLYTAGNKSIYEIYEGKLKSLGITLLVEPRAPVQTQVTTSVAKSVTSLVKPQVQIQHKTQIQTQVPVPASASVTKSVVDPDPASVPVSVPVLASYQQYQAQAILPTNPLKNEVEEETKKKEEEEKRRKEKEQLEALAAEKPTQPTVNLANVADEQKSSNDNVNRDKIEERISDNKEYSELKEKLSGSLKTSQQIEKAFNEIFSINNGTEDKASASNNKDNKFAEKMDNDLKRDIIFNVKWAEKVKGENKKGEIVNEVKNIFQNEDKGNSR